MLRFLFNHVSNEPRQIHLKVNSSIPEPREIVSWNDRSFAEILTFKGVPILSNVIFRIFFRKNLPTRVLQKRRINNVEIFFTFHSIIYDNTQWIYKYRKNIIIIYFCWLSFVVICFNIFYFILKLCILLIV